MSTSVLQTTVAVRTTAETLWVPSLALVELGTHLIVIAEVAMVKED